MWEKHLSLLVSRDSSYFSDGISWYCTSALVQKLISVGKLKIHFFSLPPPVHHHQHILHFLKPSETCSELSPLCWFYQCGPSALCRHITEMPFLKRTAVPFLKVCGKSERYFLPFSFYFLKVSVDLWKTI